MARSDIKLFLPFFQEMGLRTLNINCHLILNPRTDSRIKKLSLTDCPVLKSFVKPNKLYLSVFKLQILAAIKMFQIILMIKGVFL